MQDREDLTMKKLMVAIVVLSMSGCVINTGRGKVVQTIEPKDNQAHVDLGGGTKAAGEGAKGASEGAKGASEGSAKGTQ
jgi:hypothetical protein